MREKNNYSLTELLRTFGVSSSSYRHHYSEKMSTQRTNQIKLVAEMKAIHNDSKLKVYGSPRMTEELKSRGYQCSENTVARLMREHGLVAKGMKTFKPPKTTTVDKQAKYSPNKLENQHSNHFALGFKLEVRYSS